MRRTSSARIPCRASILANIHLMSWQQVRHFANPSQVSLRSPKTPSAISAPKQHGTFASASSSACFFDASALALACRRPCSALATWLRDAVYLLRRLQHLQRLPWLEPHLPQPHVVNRSNTHEQTAADQHKVASFLSRQQR